MSMQMTPYRDGSFDHRESEADDFLGVNFDGKSTLVELKPHRRWSTCALVAVCCASFCAVAAAAVGVAYVLERDLRLRRRGPERLLQRVGELVLGAYQRPVALRDFDDAKPEMFATRNRRCSRRAKPEMFATRNRRAR